MHIVVVMIGLVALTATMPDAFYDRVGAVVTGEDSTGSGRTEIWQAGFEALRRFGILGAGLDNFPAVHRIYVTQGPKPNAMGAHNIYLLAWVELGIFGLAMMLAAAGGHLLSVRRVRRAGNKEIILAALEGACFGVLALSLFADLLWTKFFWLPWILVTWAMSCDRQEKDAAFRGGSISLDASLKRLGVG